MDTDDDHDGNRRLFHTSSGVFDLSRLIEQLIPSIVIGAIIIYANSVSMQNQLADMKTKVDRTEERVTAQNEKLIALSSQVVAYLAQQNQLNTAVDARLTYMERDRGVTRR